MKSPKKTTPMLLKSLLLVMFVGLAPAALASTWYVSGVNGNDNNDCTSWNNACKTIGHAISLCSPGDIIGVAPATYTENLTINTSLSIIGSGATAAATTTIVDGGTNGTVFTISSTTANVTLANLTIQHGSSGSGGGVSNSGTLTVDHTTITGNIGGNGADLYNAGTLTVNYSTISGNRVTECCIWDGGGIFNTGTLTISDSTISGNSAPAGGGITNWSGTAAINNSTISGNSAGYSDGGGLVVLGTATINNSTITGNSAELYGGGICTGSCTLPAGSVIVQNSIVASNSRGGNCFGTVTSNGYNLSDDNSCSFSGPGDLNNTKALLGPLQDNGGPTQTQAEFLHSPTVDAGNPNGCTDGNGNLLTTDQRGAPRPGKFKNDKRCDMGAYERQTD